MNFSFYTKRSNSVTYPAFHLIKDNWDDFGHKTTFSVYYYESYDSYKELGTLKVLDNLSDNTLLPEVFNKLTDQYCSLGQSIEYYESLKKLFPDEYPQILRSLNDVAFYQEIADIFESHSGFNHSLLRFGSAEKAFLEARELLINNVIKVNDALLFTYSIKIEGATAHHEVDFNFERTEKIPYRINVLIGKNGTGKTTFLGSMVESISGLNKANSFTPYKPLFNKVIAISYSLFDDFPKPPETTIFSYKYIGLRTEKEEIISDERLGEKLKTALRLILDSDREFFWFSVIDRILSLKYLGLHSPDDLDIEWIESISYKKAKRLSSGQSIILFILTELIANIQEQTLILFDEPETHLHPSAIAQLMNSFYQILDSFNSYAILSTHSPIIIQDIPSQYISVFERQENLPIIRGLSMETFGENISELTSIAFGTVEVKELYKTYLEKMYLDNWGSITEVKKAFKNKLSFNAELYLAALAQLDRNEES